MSHRKKHGSSWAKRVAQLIKDKVAAHNSTALNVVKHRIAVENRNQTSIQHFSGVCHRSRETKVLRLS